MRRSYWHYEIGERHIRLIRIKAVCYLNCSSQLSSECSGGGVSPVLHEAHLAIDCCDAPSDHEDSTIPR